MNNFNGQLTLYPEICIDNFSSDIIYNIKIRCFILTHFHDDHMKNLEDFSFFRILKENTDLVKFYCSPITKKFIQTCEKYSHLTDYCNEVPCESPFIVNISSKETVTISFCGSGHCPGSVMAFIEGSRGNVLFTGDFRLPLNCASRLPFFKDKNPTSLTFLNKNENKSNLKEEHTQIKSVNDLYVDMTFFKPEITYIPTREESCKALLLFLKEFLNLKTDDQSRMSKSASNLKRDYQIDFFDKLVYFKTSARIGYEFIYQEIYKTTGFKIHVNDLIYKIYDQLPQIQSSLTTNPYETPIHACIYENKKRDLAKTDLMSSGLNSKMRKSYSFSCKMNHQIDPTKPLIPCLIDFENEKEFSRPLKVNAVKIILSAMWFTDTAGVDRIFIEYKPKKQEMLMPAYKPYKSIYRLCYSFHSSLEEIVDFVNTLTPNKIYSIALPESTTEKNINDYFYDSNGKFIGFHQVKDKSEISRKLSSNDKKEPINSNTKNTLVLRKRKSCEFNYYSSNENSNDDENSSSDNDKSSDRSGLNFGSSDEDENHFKKLKKTATF